MHTKLTIESETSKAEVIKIKSFSFEFPLPHPTHPKLRLADLCIWGDALLYSNDSVDIITKCIQYKKIDVSDILLWSGSMELIESAIRNHIRNLVFPDIDILFLNSKAA